MKEFFQYFFGAGDQVEFTNFSLAHFLPILVLLGILFLIYRFRDQLRQYKKEEVFRYIIAFLLILSEMSYYWRLVGMPSLGPNAADHLPITVCGWAVVFCSYMVIGKNQTLFDISYFWLFAGSIFALITPAVISHTGPTRFRYYQFWAEHTLGYIAIFYMIFVHGMRPTVRSAIKSYAALLVLAVIPGANYLFLARPEAAPSVLDILPPNFFLRTAIITAVVTALYVVAYLPWYFKDKKAKK